jgi:hypothetical protein
VANTYTYPSADLHSVPDVYPVAYTNSYALPDTESRSDVHAIPDIHAMAYVDTDTCAYGYCNTDADSDCYTNAGSANTTAWTDGYADACSYSYSCTDTDTDACTNSDRCTDAYSDCHTYCSWFKWRCLCGIE